MSCEFDVRFAECEGGQLCAMKGRELAARARNNGRNRPLGVVSISVKNT